MGAACLPAGEMNGTRVLYQANSQGDKQASAIVGIKDKRCALRVMTVKLRNRAGISRSRSKFNELLKQTRRFSVSPRSPTRSWKFVSACSESS